MLDMRPNAAMPSFANLPERDINYLTDYRSCVK